MKLKKTIFTLNIDGYSPEITELTFPLLKYYADKIGAEFYVIKDRLFNWMPVTYEKMQIFQLAREMKNDWNIYIDADALIHPDTIDWTTLLKKDTVAHNSFDFSNSRYRSDDYFLRDGRHIASCNWFTIASDWCIDLWYPLELSLQEALDNINPDVDELQSGITKEHLIDDYTLSRNIARFGLKAVSIKQLQKEHGFEKAGFHWHVYKRTNEQKVNGWDEIMPDSIPMHKRGIKEVLDAWGIPKSIREYGTR